MRGSRARVHCTASERATKLDGLGAVQLLTEQGSKITTPVHYTENKNVAATNAVNDHVLPYRKASPPGAQVIAASAASMGVPGQQEKSFGDGVDEAVCYFLAAALGGDVEPNVFQVLSRAGRQAVGHQRGAERWEERRA